MAEYLGTQGVKYIVGRPFTSEEGEHNTGEEVDPGLAESWRYVEALVNSGYLYKVYDEGYDRLPPHVYNSVMLKHEAEAKIEGDSSYIEAQNDWNKPKVLKDAEKQAEIDEKVHELVLDHAAAAHEQAGFTPAEKVLQEEQKDVEYEKRSAHNPPRRQGYAAKKATKKA